MDKDVYRCSCGGALVLPYCFFKDLDKNSSDGVDSDASKDNVKKVEDVNETKSIWTTATPNAVIKQRNKLDLLPKSDTKAKNKHKNIGASKGKEKCGSDDRGGAGNNGEGKVYNTEFSHKDKHGTVIHSISNRTSKNYSKLHEKERVSDSDQSQGNEENEEVVKEESEQEVIRQSEDDDKDSGSKNEEEDEHKPKMKEMTPAPQEHFISKEEDEKLSFSQVQCNNDIDSGKDANDTDVHRTDDTDKDGDTLICAVLIDLLSKVNNTVTRMYDETCGNGQLKSVSHFSPNLLEALMTMHDAQKQVLLAVTKLNDHVDDLMNTLKEAHQAASTVHETIAATF
ncbi:hypothetical protein EDD11_005573 [Mortierella claussenii]|nr:hypothetical protein EDD11_005573 [Mortierella claussenii]